MKLTLKGHDYRYAAEQMMLTLFPGERPGAGENALTLSLFRGESWLTARAELIWEGVSFSAVRRARVGELTGGLTDDRVCQRILKLAFYDAGTRALGKEPPWGALTGVRPVKIPAKAMEQGLSPLRAERLLRDIYRVSPIRRRLAMDCAGESVAARRSLRGDEVSLYVGIPFCPSRCVYCSFISAAVERCLPLVEPFVTALEREIEATGTLLRETGRTVRTLYVGGGTPTTLSAPQLERVLSALERCLPMEGCSEFTVEAGRPDTITPEKLAVLSKHRVDRVSVNPQSMEDGVLERMGRPHTGADIRRAYGEVRRAGAFAVNMDLIAGLPGDTPEGFARSLSEVLSMGPENVTVHTLALKKGSRLTEEGSSLPSAEQVEQMLDRAWDVLREAGYAPYYLYRQKYMSGSFENVGWAKSGCASLYNIAMMEELHTILALGGGGVTKLVWPESGKIKRVANPKYPQEYLRDVEKICREKGALAPFLRETKGVQ
ncbi:coproporphyrinogen dehydrogenase HemZ [Candidatus Pseudoscillospira sp. SGI.172]|uniref:coproporphyrinogen dehydrogenase HemZ n=1 Tax=Candidatus Pseudoscillospira sp. SGI.172 TaxID=3420582 RepID=UPI002A7C7F2D|nr:coproporphyrinogen dehydrogenase HemZ [Pseudoflavonifractor sp.]MDY3019909.1 coproporphyrinogen dehydrogenase HemZ [Oscillospiraceae bacterium]